MWKYKVVSPEEVLSKIEPGMAIFLGTGMAEPRTLVKHLMASEEPNLQDLELIQLVSIGDTIPIDERYSRKLLLRLSARAELILFPADFHGYPDYSNREPSILMRPSFRFHHRMKTVTLVCSG
jgi:hypothetical protein